MHPISPHALRAEGLYDQEPSFTLHGEQTNLNHLGQNDTSQDTKQSKDGERTTGKYVTRRANHSSAGDPLWADTKRKSGCPDDDLTKSRGSINPEGTVKMQNKLM